MFPTRRLYVCRHAQMSLGSQTDARAQVIRTFTGACDVMGGFAIKVRESGGHLCEIVLEGVGGVDARTCLALTRHPRLRCDRVRFADGELRYVPVLCACVCMCVCMCVGEGGLCGMCHC